MSGFHGRCRCCGCCRLAGEACGARCRASGIGHTATCRTARSGRPALAEVGVGCVQVGQPGRVGRVRFSGSPRSSAEGCSVMSTLNPSRRFSQCPRCASPQGRAHELARRRGAERHECLGSDEIDLAFQPVQTCRRLLLRGVLWMRRLPRSSNLKCLTAFVTYTLSRASRAPRRRDRTTGPQGRRRAALHVFLVARLLADEHEPRTARPLARHPLGRGARRGGIRGTGPALAAGRRATPGCSVAGSG